MRVEPPLRSPGHHFIIEPTQRWVPRFIQSTECSICSTNPLCARTSLGTKNLVTIATHSHARLAPSPKRPMIVEPISSIPLKSLLRDRSSGVDDATLSFGRRHHQNLEHPMGCINRPPSMMPSIIPAAFRSTDAHPLRIMPGTKSERASFTSSQRFAPPNQLDD